MTFAVVTSVLGQSTDFNAVTTSPAKNTTGSDLIVVATSTSLTAATLSDTISGGPNTYVAKTARTFSNNRINPYYKASPVVGASHTWTATGSGSSPSLGALAVSGVDTTTPFDKESGNGAFGTSVQPGSITPTNPNALVVCTLTYSSGATVSIDSGFTLLFQGPDGAGRGIALAYKILTTAVACNPTWSWSGNADAATSQMIFNAASGGGPTYKNVTGAAAGVASSAGVTTRRRSVTGASTGATTVTAAISRRRGLTAASTGVAVTTAPITRRRSVTGASAGVAATTGLIGKKGSLLGASAGVATTTSLLTRKRALVGASAGHALTSGTVTSVTPGLALVYWSGDVFALAGSAVTWLGATDIFQTGRPDLPDVTWPGTGAFGLHP